MKQLNHLKIMISDSNSKFHSQQILAQLYEDKRFLIANHKQAREPSETRRTPRTSSEPIISLAPCFTHFYWFIVSVIL